MTYNLPNFEDTGSFSNIELVNFKPILTNQRYIHPSIFFSMRENPDEAWAGVYFLIDRHFEHINFGIVYVGESQNIGSRIAGHKSNKRFDKVCYIYCSDEKERKLIEQYYIYQLKPIYNNKVPAHKPFGIEDFTKGW